jgi:uncharacterized protein (TIGR02217 family)
LRKVYVSGPGSWQRTIKKPVDGTVRIAIGEVEQMEGWSVDSTTGIAAFTTAPANGAAITAGFEFDTPVRFDTDSLSINLSTFMAGEIPSIPIAEILL